MADIKLFRVGAKVEELKSSAVDLEKKLQTLIERNMGKFFNVTFLASEYIIPEGRMDSVGIDENNAPGVARGTDPIGGVEMVEQRLWRCRRETILLRAARYGGQVR